MKTLPFQGNPNISDYMSKVTAEYHKTIEAIQELE